MLGEAAAAGVAAGAGAGLAAGAGAGTDGVSACTVGANAEGFAFFFLVNESEKMLVRGAPASISTALADPGDEAMPVVEFARAGDALAPFNLFCFFGEGEGEVASAAAIVKSAADGG